MLWQSMRDRFCMGRLCQRSIVWTVVGICVLFVGFGAMAQQITLKWATWGPEHIDRQLIAAFEAQHPDIKIEYIGSVYGEHHDKVKIQTAAGIGPDIFAVDGYYIAEFVTAGLLLPLDGLLAEDASFSMEDYFPAALPDVQYRGRTYGLPYISAPQYMVYNVSHFKESGLALPDPHWTRDEFVDYARRLTRTDGSQTIRYGSSEFLGWDRFWPWVWSAGGRVFDENHKKFLLTEPEALDGLNWMNDMRQAGLTISPVSVPFASDNVSISFMYPAGFPSVTGQNWPFEWDVILWPAGPGGQYSIWKGNAMGISATTEHPEAAWLFLKFLLGPASEGHRIYVANKRFQPQSRDAELWSIWNLGSAAYPSAPSLMEITLLLASHHGRALPKLLQWDAIVSQTIGPALQQIQQGTVAPRVAMEQIRERVEQLLANEP